MEKSEKAKQLRALRKYGKKVRKNTCTDRARPGMPGEVAVVPALCVFGTVGFTAGIPEHRFTWHHGTLWCTQHSVVAAGELIDG